MSAVVELYGSNLVWRIQFFIVVIEQQQEHVVVMAVAAVGVKAFAVAPSLKCVRGPMAVEQSAPFPVTSLPSFTVINASSVLSSSP